MFDIRPLPQPRPPPPKKATGFPHTHAHSSAAAHLKRKGVTCTMIGRNSHPQMTSHMMSSFFLHNSHLVRVIFFLPPPLVHRPIWKPWEARRTQPGGEIIAMAMHIQTRKEEESGRWGGGGGHRAREGWMFMSHDLVKR